MTGQLVRSPYLYGNRAPVSQPSLLTTPRPRRTHPGSLTLTGPSLVLGGSLVPLSEGPGGTRSTDPDVREDSCLGTIHSQSRVLFSS